MRTFNGEARRGRFQFTEVRHVHVDRGVQLGVLTLVEAVALPVKVEKVCLASGGSRIIEERVPDLTLRMLNELSPLPTPATKD